MSSGGSTGRGDAGEAAVAVELPVARGEDAGHRGGASFGGAEVGDDLRVAQVDADDAVAVSLQAPCRVAAPIPDADPVSAIVRMSSPDCGRPDAPSPVRPARRVSTAAAGHVKELTIA